MSCRKVQFLIQGYLDGEASAPERALVEQHVARCRACEAELKSGRALAGLLSGSPTRPVSDAFETRLMAAVEAARPASPPAAWWERFRLRFEWRLRFPALMTAGSFAAAALAGLVYLQVQDFQQAQQERQEYVSTAVRRYEQLQRADSKVNWDEVNASIELNSGSIVTE